jgi:hypothetical protein
MKRQRNKTKKLTMFYQVEFEIDDFTKILTKEILKKSKIKIAVPKKNFIES